MMHGVTEKGKEDGQRNRRMEGGWMGSITDGGREEGWRLRGRKDGKCD